MREIVTAKTPYGDLDLNNPPQRVLRNFKVRPLREYEEHLEMQAFFERKRSEWLREAWTKNLTGYIPAEFKFGYHMDGNTIIIIMGPPGDGKSTVARSVVLRLQTLIKQIRGIDVTIHLAFSDAEAFRKIGKMKRGDILFRDENPQLSGEGAMTVKNAVRNIQANVRANLNCFIFVSPAEKGYENCSHILIETYGINKEDYGGLNRVKVYSAKTERLLGWAIIPRIVNKEFELHYEARKKRHIAQLFQSSGLMSGTYDPDQMEKEGQLLLQKTRDRFVGIQLKRKHFAAVITTVNIPGSRTYQNHVITWAEALLDFEAQLNDQQLKTEHASQVSLEGIDFNQGIFEAFVEAMQRFIKVHLPQFLPDSTKIDKIVDDAARVYEQWVKGYDAEEIYTVLKKPRPSQRTVERRLINLVRLTDRNHGAINEQIGKLYEDVFCNYHRAQGHNVIQEGGSKAGGIDAIVDGQAWSLKCYHYQKGETLKVKWDHISKGEKEYARTSNPLLGISLLNPFWQAEVHTEVPINDLERKGFVSFTKPRIPT